MWVEASIVISVLVRGSFCWIGLLLDGVFSTTWFPP